MNMEQNIQEIPIEDIIPNRFQPRLMFNENGINELSDSIKQHGIIQPLVVRRLGDKYEIIAGERRYKAATQAGLTKVPVIISSIDDNKSAEVALVENIQRRNLTAIEEAKSYKNLLDRGYLTQEQLANKMGVSQSAIANKLRLLNLDPEVQEALLNEKISERHARALLSLDNKEDQKKWLQRIIDERMTVRQLDMELKKLKENNGTEDTGIPLVNINPNLEEMVNNAEDINTIRAPHDVASMLIPDHAEQKSTITEIPTEEGPKPMPNKFFNFLEDEQANMDVGASEDVFNTYIPTAEEIQPEQSITNNQMPTVDIETLDDLEENTKPTPIAAESTEEYSPFQNIFFNNQNPVIEEKPTPVVENTNTIEEIQPIIEEKLVDPLDSIITLEPDYEAKQEEIAGTDLKTAINTIRETVDELNKKGFIVEIDEADLEDIYHMTIKINKP